MNEKRRVRDIFTRISDVFRFLGLEAVLKTSQKPEISVSEMRVNTGRIRFSREVLDSFRTNVGRFLPETGGLLGCTKDESLIDLSAFDTNSQNTPGTFYYDVPSMTAVFNSWSEKGYITNGIIHSHPLGVTEPSYHDISTALLHIDFFKIEYFYLPIIQPEKDGNYCMYFYVVREKDDNLEVNLEYVLKAMEDGYMYETNRYWSRSYSIKELREYREVVDGKKNRNAIEQKANKSNEESCKEYFSKVESLYPSKVLDKVIVCIGTGGARSFLENMARCGFRNFILMDKDVVSASNIATQAVYVSEIGKKKIEVIRDRILDINPSARVQCVDDFLDDSISDDKFKFILKSIPDKKPSDYLILGCTDSFEAQKRSAYLAMKYGIPYMAAMMYEKGAAAEIIFVYPGVTESCPRCLLRSRFEKYENGFVNDVDSAACPIFATERMNALKGYIALMMLMYHEEGSGEFGTMLDEVKNRNFVEIRLNPHLRDSNLKIDLFDRVLECASGFTYMDETLWIPQHPDRPEFGEENCKLCGGDGDLRNLKRKMVDVDTRKICKSIDNFSLS